MIGYLRALLARVDSSLVEEWESLVDPSRPIEPEAPEQPERAPRRLDRRAFEARLRAELHQLLRALARGDYEGASACIAPGGWDAERFEQAIAPVLEAQGPLRADPEARRAHWTRIDARSELAYDVVQTLIDEEGEGAGQLEATVELEETRMPTEPMLRMVAIRV